MCNNTGGSFNCDCRAGFKLKPDKRGCEGNGDLRSDKEIQYVNLNIAKGRRTIHCLLFTCSMHVRTLHKVISRRSRRVVTKKFTRKRDVRGELLFCLSNLFLFLKCSSPSLLKLPNSEQMWGTRKISFC